MFKPLNLLLFFLLTACHVGQDYQQPLFISDKDVLKELALTPSEKTITTDWYKIFDDNDLNTLLSYLNHSNLTIKQAIERLKQSRLQFAIQSKQSFPMIDANGGYTYQKAHSQSSYATDINTFKIGFDSAWEIDIWGKRQYLSEQYFELMKNSEYNLLQLKAVMTAEIASNYINLRKAQEQLKIAKHNLILQNDILNSISDKYAAGIADDLALSQAQFSVEQTKATIPPLELDIENNKNSLAVLLGVTPNRLPINLDKPKKNITASTFKYTVKDLYKLPLNILRTRPDILAAEAEIRAQNAAVNEAIAELYPNVDLASSFGYVSVSGKSLISPQKQLYGYAPTLSLPIWHWKQLQNNINLQEHIREEYLLNYNNVLLTALVELKNAIYAVEKAYKTNIHQSNSFYKMKNIMALTNEKYKNGLVNFTDVATAEQNLLEAQLSLADSNAQILQSIIAFYKATGGGYNLK